MQFGKKRYIVELANCVRCSFPKTTVCGVPDPLIWPVSAAWGVCQNVFMIRWRFRWRTVGMDLLGVARLSNLGEGTGAGLMT
jgi:hypothetical protein